MHQRCAHPVTRATAHPARSATVALHWRHDRHRPAPIDALFLHAGQARRRQDAEVSRRLDQLTQREREVLDLIIVGKLNKQIADVLGISIKTVEVHRARVMN